MWSVVFNLTQKQMGVLFNEWLEFVTQVKMIYGITFPSKIAGEAIRNGIGPPTLEEFAAIHKLKTEWPRFWR